MNEADQTNAKVMGKCQLPSHVLLMCFTGCLVWFSGVKVLANENVKKDFPTEASQKWRQYVERVAQFQSSVESDLTDVLHDKVLMRGTTTVKVSGAWGVSVGGDTNSETRSVRGVNSKYAFRLKAATGKDWMIEKIDWLARDDAKKSPQAINWSAEDSVVSSEPGTRSPGMSVLCRGLMLSSNWFPSIVQSPDFQLVSVNEQEGGEGLIRVKFTYTPTNSVSNVIGDGFVVLDPNKYWLIREAKTEGTWGAGEKGEIVIKNDFDMSLGDVPLLKQHREDWIGTDESVEKVHHVRELRVERWSRSKDDETEYTLSAFGIPEPRRFDEPQDRGWFSRLLLIVNGVVGALGLLWYLLYRARTKANGQAHDGGRS